MGYNELSKGYKIWDLVAKKIVESRNVRFNEETLAIHMESSTLLKLLGVESSNFEHGRHHGEHDDGHNRDLHFEYGYVGIHLDGGDIGL